MKYFNELLSFHKKRFWYYIIGVAGVVAVLIFISMAGAKGRGTWGSPRSFIEVISVLLEKPDALVLLIIVGLFAGKALADKYCK